MEMKYELVLLRKSVLVTLGRCKIGHKVLKIRRHYFLLKPEGAKFYALDYCFLQD